MILKIQFLTFLTLTALPLLCVVFVIQSTLCIHVNTVPRWFSAWSRVHVWVGVCVFMHLCALVWVQRGVAINSTSLLEASMPFLPIFLCFQIILHFIFLHFCMHMCFCGVVVVL